MSKNGRTHPKPYDSFEEKAKLDRADKAALSKPAPKPAWKDRIPFSGIRKDGKPVGKSVVLPKRLRRAI